MHSTRRRRFQAPFHDRQLATGHHRPAPTKLGWWVDPLGNKVSEGEIMPNGQLKISTVSNVELVNITSEIDKILQSQTISSGVIHLFNPHTTAGLIINEGADPDVCRDIVQGLAHMVPRNLGYKHREGNSPSHIMAMLTGSCITIFIENGKLQLGTWQKVFFCEFDGPRTRSVRWKIIADPQQPFANTQTA